MRRGVIVGPVQSDLSAVGMEGAEVVLATAFYSAGVLDDLEIAANRIRLLVRLDLKSTDEWIRGTIAPDALLRFFDRHVGAGREVLLRSKRHAHAKVYWGSRGYMVGSANLTRRGLSGENELLVYETDRTRRTAMRRALRCYAEDMEPITANDLRVYVEDNQVEVKKRARKERQPWSDENRPVKITKVRPKRLGDYGSFLRWLGRRSRSAAAREIRDRAKGKGQLGGHIHRNFYGLRQFLLARPALMRRFEMEDPNDFTLRGAADVKVALGTFVRMEAADEGDFFKLDTWRTYLPESCGGKPKSGSGTQGNLNRMLPLVARYLAKGLNSP